MRIRNQKKFFFFWTGQSSTPILNQISPPPPPRRNEMTTNPNFAPLGGGDNYVIKSKIALRRMWETPMTGIQHQSGAWNVKSLKFVKKTLLDNFFCVFCVKNITSKSSASINYLIMFLY